ncbi:MAG: DUF4366 domain-containing protein [Clostridiales bacterium]|nr:DUF4366 domain-containing protein [Clostridiales bacterium]MDO5141325.1 DUF4366 domain-containing protein [Eubacteriales bacterium]
MFLRSFDITVMEEDMDRFNTLVSLNEAKKTIEDLIIKVRQGTVDHKDEKKLVIIILSVVGALAIVGIAAYAVYKHFSNDSFEDYDDLFDDEDEDEDEDPEGDGVSAEDIDE